MQAPIIRARCDVPWPAFSSTNAFARFTLLRRAGFVSFSAIITFLTPSAPTDTGIAARYPGDKNIGSDPAVILADDFEGYTSPSELTAKWSNAGVQANLRIATKPGTTTRAGKLWRSNCRSARRTPISRTLDPEACFVARGVNHGEKRARRQPCRRQLKVIP